jgi:hypothetical protein
MRDGTARTTIDDLLEAARALPVDTFDEIRDAYDIDA